MAGLQGKTFVFCFILTVSRLNVQGFIPNDLIASISLTSDSFTHTEITESAHRAVAVMFMNDYPAKYPNHTAAMSTSDFKEAVGQFKKGAAAPDLNELKNVHRAHVDAESFADFGPNYEYMSLF